MEEIKIASTEEILYYDKLDNGLEIFLLPNKKSRNFYITYNVKYGSIYTDFRINNNSKMITTSKGVAHFLEHLMFIEPNNKTAHEKFAKLGASINAATSYKLTFYETLSVDLFKENLNYLLDYVSRICFTKKDIEKERNIIIEEIKMGQGSPYRQLHFNSKKNIYHQLKYKDEVSGLVADVKKITYEELVNCYNTFYHPQNMFLVITGNFNPYEAKAIIAENMSCKKFPKYKNFKLKKIIEKDTVVKEYEEQKMNIMIPKVSYNIKLSAKLFKNSADIISKLYLMIFLDLKFDMTSQLNEKLLSNNLIADTILPTLSYDKESVLITLLFDSLYPQEVIRIIKESMKDNKFTSNDLERKKRVLLSNYILSFDDIITVNEEIQKNIILYDDPLTDLSSIIKSLNYQNFISTIKKINLDNTSTYIIKPNEKNS